MADSVRKVRYGYVMIPNRPGQAARMLLELKNEGVDLLAFTGFPGKKGAQVDFVTQDMTGLKRLARRNGWKLSAAKKGFLVQGADRIGAVHRHLAKLAAKKINIVAADAVGAGKGRYGMVLWVRPKDYAKAARALGAR
jgi:microcompartment protein CcmK/EutM